MKTGVSLLAISITMAAPTWAQTAAFKNSLSAPPPPAVSQKSFDPAAGDRNVKVVESEGHGKTELQARKEAVDNAVQNAVGVFIDSSRRSQMDLTDGNLHEIVQEKIQTYSSAFVEKIDSISTNLDQQGGYVVKLRAYVSVPNLVEAMQQADLPVAKIDAVSNQAKFASQIQMTADAAEVAGDRLRDLTSILVPNVDPTSITSTLAPEDSNFATLQGQVVFKINRAKLTPSLQAFQSFGSLRINLPNGDSPSSWRAHEIAPNGVVTTLQFSICKTNVLGQAECHGESLDARKIYDAYKGIQINFELLQNNEAIGTVSARLLMNCVAPAQGEKLGYLEGPFLHNNATIESPPLYTRQSNMMWNYLKGQLRNAPIVVVVGAKPITLTARPDLSTFSPPPQNQTPVIESAGAVCLERESYSELRLMIPNQPVSITRSFAIVGSRDIISKVDGLRATMVPVTETGK